MEGREVISNSGVTAVGSDVPSDYHVTPRTNENPPPQPAESTPPAAPPQYGVAPPPSDAAGVVSLSTTVKKKRGRPRKYGLDGSAAVTAKAISPKPISSIVLPQVMDFSAAAKRGKVRQSAGGGSTGKPHQPRMELANLSNGGDWVSCSVGANFTPHIITVNAGEDVTMKIISFSQQGPRAICILSANGVISSVTLRQSESSGGTLTYEGRFEILSLTGSFMPSESGGMKNRSGGMSVSLASPDGRVMGGGVAGLLVAASPVQIVVGSFLASNHVEQKAKNQKAEQQHVTMSPAPTVPFTISRTAESEEGNHPFQTSPSFRGDNWSSLPSNSTTNKPTADINITPLPG